MLQFLSITGISLLLTAVLALGIRDREKTILTSFLFVGFFLSYRLCHDGLSALFSFVDNHFIPFFLHGLLVALLLRWVLSLAKTKPMKHLMKFCHNVSYLALVLSLGGLGVGLFNIRGMTQPSFGNLEYQATSAPSDDKASCPDIYYLTFDGYCRQDVLKESYGYDNSPFLNELKALGFTISEKSTCNYPATYASLPATLNMQYIKDATISANADFYYTHIQDNEVARYLKKAGYTYATVDNGWCGTQMSTEADVHYALPWSHSFLSLFLEGSALSPWMMNHADSVRHSIQSTQKAIALPSPKFVFSHTLMPHSPYSFKANGEERDLPNYLLSKQLHDAPDKSEEGRRAYIEQLKYCNDEILKMVQNILENSETAPIIILQSDHGWAKDKADFTNEEFCKGRYPVLNAMLVPEELGQQLDSQFSTVNTFRMLLNHLFKEELPLLENKLFGPSFEVKNTYEELPFKDVY